LKKLQRTFGRRGRMVPEYDLVVIGSDPAGQKCAIAAANARKSVAVIDRTVPPAWSDFPIGGKGGACRY